MGKAIVLILIVSLNFSCHNNSVIEPIDYVKILLNKPDKEIVVIKCDNDWEQELSFPTIITLADKYIMYYVTYDGLNPRSFSSCYAESKDGINWTKPNLNQIDFKGSKNNNIFSKEFEGLCVEYLDGIYYLLTYAADFKTYLYKSNNGINFSKIETFTIPFCCDSQNQILYSKKNGKYNLYLRSWYKSDNKNIKYNHRDSLYRSVSCMDVLTPENINIPMSENPLWRWGKNSGIPPALSKELPIIMRNNSDDDYDIYNSCVHQYNDGSYIAYPLIYWHLPEPPMGGNSYNDGYSKLGMWYSENGVDFKSITNDYGSFDVTYFEFAIGHIETNNELIHYYVKFNKTHGETKYDRDTQIIARIHKKQTIIDRR